MTALVAGDLYLDLILTGFPFWPAPGEESFADSMHREIGGGAAITASGLAKLEVPTGIIGTVGASDGAWLIDRLAEHGVDTSGLRRDASEYTAVTVAVSDMYDRAFFTYAGTNYKTRRILEREALPAARHVHLACTPTLEAMERLRAQGYSISVDVGWHPEFLTDASNAEILRLADIFFPNQREAAAMHAWIGDLDGVMVVTKRGASGAEALVDGKLLTDPGFTVEARDTTGAGDCFDAGFLAGWLAGEPVDVCLRMGNACGALSTRELGGIAGMPTKAQLKEFLCAE
jgi:sugar/nucleoside kinase (ribokinase family)